MENQPRGLGFTGDPIQALFQKLIRKQNSAHLINRDKIVGHSLAIGNPGAGKTSGNRRELELRWQAGHKIFCLYDAGRMDLAFFMFPSVSPFWKKPKLERGKIIGPRRYPVELLYPVTKDIPKKIPKAGVPFTIPVCDLDENDIAAMAGASARDMIRGLFSYMQDKVDEQTTPEDFINIMGTAMKKVQDIDGIKPSHHAAKKMKFDIFQPLLQQGILSSKTAATALNIEEKIRDKNTISVLVLRHCPQNLWGFLVHYFMNHLFKTLAGIGSTKNVKQKTTIILNEIPDLLGNDEESGGSAWAVSKAIGRIAKQSRTSDMFMLLDCQLPQELPDVKDTMQRIYVYNSGIAEVQKAMEIIGISTRTGEIGSDDLMIIPRLQRGWYYLFDRESGVSIHKQVWTRSRSYHSGEDFYDIYNMVYGLSAYTDIRPILAVLKKEQQESIDAWKLRQELTTGQAQPKPAGGKRRKKADDDEDEDEEEEDDTDDNAIPVKTEPAAVAKLEEPKAVATEPPETPTPPALIQPRVRKPIDWSKAKRFMGTLG
jgi:hypothetical protein